MRVRLCNYIVVNQIVVIVIALLLSACNSTGANGKESKANDGKEGKQVKNFPNTDLYDLNNPKVIDLPTELDEISGIVYYPKDTSVFAIIDEDGILYKIPLKDPFKIRAWPFEDPKDFEDLSLRDSTFFVLKSNGDVYELKFDYEKINLNKYDFLTKDKNVNEFESMYIDPVTKSINIVCKECETDKKKKVSVYTLNDTTKQFMLTKEIETAPIGEQLKDASKIAVRASGAAVNPLNNDIYLVSSIAKALVIFDSTGTFKNVYALDPKLYKQPEGITFTPDGNMIISNEFAGKGRANLLLFKNKQNAAK